MMMVMMTMVMMVTMVEMVDNEGEDGGRDGKYEENADCMMASVINTHRAVEVGAIHNTDAIQTNMQIQEQTEVNINTDTHKTHIQGSAYFCRLGCISMKCIAVYRF